MLPARVHLCSRRAYKSAHARVGYIHICVYVCADMLCVQPAADAAAAEGTLPVSHPAPSSERQHSAQQPLCTSTGKHMCVCVYICVCVCVCVRMRLASCMRVFTLDAIASHVYR